MQMHHRAVTNLPHQVQVRRHTPPTQKTEKQSGSPPHDLLEHTDHG
jgi:hypothetical protein